MNPEMALDLLKGARLHPCPFAVEVELDFTPERLSFAYPLLAWIGLGDNKSKQTLRFGSGAIRCPGRSMPTNGDKLLRPIDPIPEQVESVLGLPSRSKSFDEGVPKERPVWELIDCGLGDFAFHVPAYGRSYTLSQEISERLVSTRERIGVGTCQGLAAQVEQRCGDAQSKLCR